MALTVPQQIQIGRISAVLAANELQGGGVQGGLLHKRLPGLLHIVTDTLEDLYTLSPSNEDLVPIGGYLISICKDAARAQNLINAGGSVSPVIPSAAPTPYQFIVSASSFIVTGTSSKTITDFIGFNLLFARNGQPVSTVTSEPNYYSWNKTTGVFTISPAAFVDELFQIYAI